MLCCKYHTVLKMWLVTPYGRWNPFCTPIQLVAVCQVFANIWLSQWKVFKPFFFFQDQGSKERLRDCLGSYHPQAYNKAVVFYPKKEWSGDKCPIYESLYQEHTNTSNKSQGWMVGSILCKAVGHQCHLDSILLFSCASEEMEVLYININILFQSSSSGEMPN